jgi:hypothetical protein
MFTNQYKIEVDGMCYENSVSFSLGYVQQIKEKLISDGASEVFIFKNNMVVSGLSHPNPFNKLSH